MYLVMCSNDLRASIAEVYIRSKDIILIEKQCRYRLNSILAGEVGTMITSRSPSSDCWQITQICSD